ncbi:hypothetical protein G6L37_02850 [Agrobacterium rubi]|nr:hypothetical protein [Agrobacterium rubi]NTF24316.1 hypothetical protein [Agrobacterium rubi]
MIDPYVYSGTDTLVNHYGIADEARLGRIERLVSVEAMVHLMRQPTAGMAFDFGTLVEIHTALFRDIYPFAGEVRTVEISKPEGVLSGRSVRYGHPDDIRPTAHAAIAALHQVDYASMAGPSGWPLFSEGLATLWRAHAFREGNTRSVLLLADLLLRSRGCNVDFSVVSRNPADTRDLLVRASEGYGRGLADLFKEARSSFIRRNHPVFGFLPSSAAALLDQVSAGRDVPARMADAGEPIRGSMLMETKGLFVIQTSKGLVGIDAGSFPERPSVGERVNVTVLASSHGHSEQEDFEIRRRIRNAILRDPGSIVVPPDAGGLISFVFRDSDLETVSEERPDLISGIAAQVLQHYDPDAWDEWNGRIARAEGGMSP